MLSSFLFFLSVFASHGSIGAGSLAWTTTSKPVTRLPPLGSKARHPGLFGCSSPGQESVETFKVDNNPRPIASPSSSRRHFFAGILTAATAGTSLLAHNSPALAAVAKIEATAALCDPTVSIWERNGRVVYLLGTAHISSTSAQLAGELVRETHPDAVFVELDLKRVGGNSAMAKKFQENGNSMTVVSQRNDIGEEATIKQTRIVVPFVGSSTTTTVASATEPTGSLVQESAPTRAGGGGGGGFLQGLGGAVVGKGIRSLYSKLGSEGFNPGEEFMVAIQEGQKQGAAVVLGDQDVDITLRRMAQAFQQTDFNKLLSTENEYAKSMDEMLPSYGSSSNSMTLDAAELSGFVETMKNKDNVKKIMGLLKNEAPAIYQVMVTERDAYMAAGLNTLNEFASICAVMGLAHIDGVENNLRREGWKPVPLRCPKQA